MGTLELSNTSKYMIPGVFLFCGTPLCLPEMRCGEMCMYDNPVHAR